MCLNQVDQVLKPRLAAGMATNLATDLSANCHFLRGELEGVLYDSAGIISGTQSTVAMVRLQPVLLS